LVSSRKTFLPAEQRSTQNTSLGRA
jgi:hypothetical protein